MLRKCLGTFKRQREAAIQQLEVVLLQEQEVRAAMAQVEARLAEQEEARARWESNPALP